MAARGEVGVGSARRRRERRLRSWWRHEQQSAKAALATALHHSAYRSVSMKKELMEPYSAREGQKKASARRAGPTECSSSRLRKVGLLVGLRPERVPDAAVPLEDQRKTPNIEHAPSLDVPALQMRWEEVFEVPILVDLDVPQTMEDEVEVPATVPSVRSLVVPPERVSERILVTGVDVPLAVPQERAQQRTDEHPANEPIKGYRVLWNASLRGPRHSKRKKKYII